LFQNRTHKRTSNKNSPIEFEYSIMLRILNVSGFSSCGAFQQAKDALKGLAIIFPKQFQVNVNERKFLHFLC
jgi:hypothetical protein